MRTKFEILILILILIFNFIFSLWLFSSQTHGFYSLHGDDICRALISYSIYKGYQAFPEGSIIKYIRSADPVFPHWLWFPFQFWFSAIFLSLGIDLLMVPFLVSSLFSAGILIILFFLLKTLLPGVRWVSLIGVIFYSSLPFFRCLDISGLDQTILNFFVLGGVLFWLRFKSKSSGWWMLLLSSFFFLMSTTVRFEGWFFVIPFELFLLWEMFHRREQRERLYLVRLMLIPLVFVIIWSIHQLASFGNLFFIEYHRTEAIAGKAQLNLAKGLLFKLGFYPGLIWITSPLIGVLSLVSFAVIWKMPRICRDYLIFVLIEFALLIATVFYVGTPYGPARIVYTNILLLLPLFPVGVYYLCSILLSKRLALYGCGLFFLISSAFNFIYTPQELRNSLSDDIFRIGYAMKWGVNKGFLKRDDRIFIEGVSGGKNQYDPIWLTLFAPDHTVVANHIYKPQDGKGNEDAANFPEIVLNTPSPELSRVLRELNIKLVVVLSGETKAKFVNLYNEVLSTENYTVYLDPREIEFNDSLKLMFEESDLYR